MAIPVTAVAPCIQLGSAALGRHRPQHPQMSAAADLDALADGLRSAGRRRLPDRIRERFEIIGRCLGHLGWRRQRKPYHFPPLGGCQPVGMRLTQVITVRLYVGGKRAEDGRRIPVHIGQRAHGYPLARRPGAAARTRATHHACSSVHNLGPHSAGPPSDPAYAEWAAPRQARHLSGQ